MERFSGERYVAALLAEKVVGSIKSGSVGFLIRKCMLIIKTIVRCRIAGLRWDERADAKLLGKL